MEGEYYQRYGTMIPVDPSCEHDRTEHMSVCCGTGSLGESDICEQCRDHAEFPLTCMECGEEVA